jgi:hypothetical protein
MAQTRVGIRNGSLFNNNSTLWNGLLAYYKGDGTANDALGNYNGTLINGATYATGKIGQGFSLDGVNDYVNISTSFGKSFSAPASAHSYSAWIYPTSVTGYNFIINNGTGTIGTSMILSNNKIAFFFRGGTNVTGSNVTIPVNTWTLVTVVYNGAGSVSFYKNGVFDVARTISWTETAGTATTNIGSYVKAIHFFDGIIDEVGAWNRELTASEVGELYNSGAGKQYPN